MWASPPSPTSLPARSRTCKLGAGDVLHAVVRHIRLAEPQALQGGHLATNDKTSSSTRVPARSSSRSAVRRSQGGEASALDQGAGQLQTLQLGQSGEFRQPGIGYGGVAEIEFLQARQTRDRGEAEVANLRHLQVQFFQTGKAR